MSAAVDENWTNEYASPAACHSLSPSLQLLSNTAYFKQHIELLLFQQA